jgi:hypothetical protein
MIATRMSLVALVAAPLLLVVGTSAPLRAQQASGEGGNAAWTTADGPNWRYFIPWASARLGWPPGAAAH